MVEYFQLEQPDSQRLRASNTLKDPYVVSQCPVTEQHRPFRRAGDLSLEVKYSKRDQWLIWAWLDGLVAHARLLEEFDKRGFTGYRLRPATIRFRDGYLSRDYSELIVTGWAGVASPESGIELVEACPGCGYKKYSALKHPEKLIDWSQWTGEDFFMVWPYPRYTLITKRVAGALAELRVKSYRLASMLTLAQSFSLDDGCSVGALSNFLPQDLAIRYGRPLGLECVQGSWPTLEPHPVTSKGSNGSNGSNGSRVAVRPMDQASELRQLYRRVRDGEGADRDHAVGAMFGLAEGEGALPFEVAHYCLTLLGRGLLRPEEVEPYTPILLRVWNGAYSRLTPLQQSGASTEWMFDDEYCGPRATGEVVLDILGYLPGAEAGRALHDGMALVDPRLKTFAIASMLRRGTRVDPSEIEPVAASLEMRMIFMRLLKDLGWESLMPREWAQPEVLAASDLCRWASHPNELGYPPDEVELMEEVLVESEEGDTSTVYLFRFREYPKPWEPGEGWMAGIAGPIVDDEAQDSPWSSFQTWDSQSPKAHFEALYYRGSGCAVG